MQLQWQLLTDGKIQRDFENDAHFFAISCPANTLYYTVILDKDLFDDWVITIINGRINTKIGRIRKLAFQNCSDALSEFDTIT